MPSGIAPVVFTNPAGSVLANPGGYAEIHYSAGQPNIPDLQALLTALGQLLLQRGWHKVLLDGRQLQPLPEALKRWTQANWITPVIARPANLELATILPTDVFSRLGVQELQLGVANGNHNRNFSDTEAAHKYLSTLPGQL